MLVRRAASTREAKGGVGVGGCGLAADSAADFHAASAVSVVAGASATASTLEESLCTSYWRFA
jgi:hypothetical protein